MTNEQWNTTLYKQMFTEQEQFRDWLLAQPPEEILNHAYEYVMREDILLSLEHNDLTDAQAAALLASPAPLADVYKELDYVESSHMEEVWSCVVDRANIVLDAQLDRAKTLIDDFCTYDYASHADFSDLSRVNIAYTTVGDEDIPLQVHVDLEGYKIERELDGKPLDVRQYGSLQELIENELEGMDFQELVAVDEKDIQLSLARAEYQENVECKLAIEQAIACYYDGSRLDSAAAREVVEKFGAERVLYVLAGTLQQNEWDGRFSQDNKAWAKTAKADPLFAHRRDFSVQSHPGLVDVFLTQVRREAEKPPRASIRERLKQAQEKAEKKNVRAGCDQKEGAGAVRGRRDQQLHFRVSKPELDRIQVKMAELGIVSIGAYLRENGAGWLLHPA